MSALHGGARRAWRARLIGGLVLFACAAAAPGAAYAGTGFGMGATLPSSSTVGDSGLGGSLTMTNLNTDPDAGSTATVCNFGDSAPPCPASETGITFVPSCGVVGAFSACPPNGADPGVFRIQPAATGGAGTACAGLSFTVTPLNDAYGSYRFSPNGAHVTLPSYGSVCRIDFKVDVLRVPSIDSQPGVPGTQTDGIADATQWSQVAPAPGTLTSSARGRATGASVNPPPPPPPPAPAALTPSGPCIPPPGPSVMPPGGQLCGPPNTASSVPTGSARVVGKSGCVARRFHVTVTGRHIRRVTFYLDGKKLKSMTKPNVGTRYRIAVRPDTLKRGTHRIVAKTSFTTASGTPGRSLRVVFQRCSRSASSPQFTG